MNLDLTYTTDADGTSVMSLPDETRAWVIDFVRENAQKPPAEMEAIVQEGKRQLSAALDGVSEGQAQFKAVGGRRPEIPSEAKDEPDEWSILDVIAHEVSVKRSIGALIAAMRDGALPPGFGPHFEEAKAQDGFIAARFGTLAEARIAAQDAHDGIAAFVRGIDASANRELTFRHYYFGAFNAIEWAIFLRVHDDIHTPQIAKIKAAPGYPAS